MLENLNFSIKNTTLATKAWGDKKNPKILALHGWLDNAASFDQLAALLAQDYYVVALDLPGHGLSSALVESHYSFASFVDLVLHMLDLLQWDTFIALGHSLGGAIATLIAQQYPQRVEKLITIDALGPISTEVLAEPSRIAIMTEMILSTKNKARSNYPSIHDMIIRRSKAYQVTAESVTPLVERGTIQVGQHYQWSFDPHLLNADLFHFTEQQAITCLQQLQCPVLLIEGENGVLTDNTIVQHRKTVIPHLTTVTLAGGHHVHLTQATTIADNINRFLTSTDHA